MLDVCALEDLVANAGVCALVDGRQVALFYLPGEPEQVFAIANYDPIGKANVLSRGLVGDSKGELVVASPLFKQHFSLSTGRCLEDPSVKVRTYAAKISSGRVLLTLNPG